MPPVTDRILLSAGRNNLDACIDLAVERDLGVEVMAFAYPDVLDGDWEALLHDYQHKLRAVSGPITVHGPFMDMVSGSPDARINAVCRERYLHALQITAALGAKLLVVHANFIGSLHNVPYREGWHARNVPFWQDIAPHAAAADVTIALENMWEFDPTILTDLLAEVNHPNLRLCLDIGHAHLFSDSRFMMQDWLQVVEPWLVHCHMNNNNGKLDEHHGFDYPKGVINYHEVLRMMRGLSVRPTLVLEMDTVDDMRASLHYLQVDIDESAPA